MPVFISYRHTDRTKALQISKTLDSHNVKYYLDVIDDESKSTENITEVVTKNIKKCTHLLALISPNTSGSWWVPFEIGEATILNRRICSYAFKYNIFDLNRSLLSIYNDFLPEYLHKWPILLSDNDLEKFINEYKKDSQIFSFESLKSDSFNTLTQSGANSFHRTLKDLL